jgi:hypothetical protein
MHRKRLIDSIAAGLDADQQSSRAAPLGKGAKTLVCWADLFLIAEGGTQTAQEQPRKYLKKQKRNSTTPGALADAPPDDRWGCSRWWMNEKRVSRSSRQQPTPSP